MVGAISSTSLLSAVSTTSSASGTAQRASLEAQIEAKRTELDEAKTDAEKTEIEQAIATLQAKLDAIAASEAEKSRQPQTPPAAVDQSTQAASLIGTRNFEDGETFGNRELWV